jgi:hypothetical protein
MIAAGNGLRRLFLDYRIVLGRRFGGRLRSAMLDLAIF